jgi:ADP-ribose pyrophosphatase YjhB (NUDIX family)/2-polyprenyl-3-methyl-5-hydroxy-6-metoxy-1,4-benzoquinol methylase
MSPQKLIRIYKKLYCLPSITYNESIPRENFCLYKKRHFFINVSIYNSKKEIFLIRDFNKNIGWELPGGYIHEEENIIDTINRIVLKETGLEVSELEPIAVVYNNFTCEKKLIQHKGMAFIACSRGKIKKYPENIKGYFVKDGRYKLAYQNNKIVTMAKEKILKKTFIPPEEEINSINKKSFSFLYFLHKNLIKPIGRSSSARIEKELLGLVINNPNTILDASCGESNLLNLLHKKYHPQICIGNDICWKTISLLKDKSSGIIFTNHNVLALPYKVKFDLVIFKNTLHHIESINQKKVIDSLKKIAKQLIIIDIDDPTKYSFWSKIWNKYYVFFLKDKGKYFLNFLEFKKLIERCIYGKNCEIKKVKTIKGGYFIASIT